ncbi:serine hydrolase domain-containing protein [Nocardioides xinjiangensis]|uniref:serine hydrolase domain-containing protein n=1 Tax=Nocardioides xinjiangensis TaxID=2817376 RepID=UPI001B30F24A|nr:serine hydrolase domain-containing protein [Nocardioides sp. SYSU D00514]
MRRLAAFTCVLALSLGGCSEGSPVTADPTPSVGPESSRTAATEGPNADETADEIEYLLEAYRGTYPGAVVLVRVGDETRVVSGGHAVVGEPGAVTARHRFPVGSVTKTMVATAVIQLVQEGKLSLSDSVRSWLPGMVPRGDRISVEQLLAHRSGLYNFTDSPRFEWTPGWDPPELLRLATTEAPVHAPGTQSSYSNTNYIVLGLIVERVTGNRLEEVLQERIFAPSDMRDTSLAKARVTDPPRAHGYEGRRDVTHDDLSFAWAAGGVVSSARDLDAFLSGLTSGELLDAEAFEDMARPRGELRNGGNVEYGLGLGRRHVRCATVIGHGGAVPGFLTEAWTSENGERAVVAMVSDAGSYTVLDGLLTTALCG